MLWIINTAYVSYLVATDLALVSPIQYYPVIVALPKVICFFIMCGKKYSLSTRNAYYRVRLVTIILLVIIAIAYAIFDFVIMGIMIGLLISTIFQIYFTLVARSFYLDFISPTPEDDASNWDRDMYRNRQGANGQGNGGKMIDGIPAGGPGE